jgi:3-oxoacyl-[acyl-carrier protein] reductase
LELGLQGKVALVGGASRGIGRAVAEGLAREGCRVAICARDAARLETAADEIRGTTRADVLAVPCDMALAEDIERFVREAVERFGRIDIVVNNAGGPPAGSFDTHDDSTWQKALDQNFYSVVRTVRAALPHLRAAGAGRVVNITSMAVKEPIPGLILSNAARLGVVGLAKTLSRELGPDNITVNNVCPGLTLTDRMRELYGAQAAASGTSFDDVLADQAQRIPLRRLASANDVAALVVFLASEQARHITGTTIQVDGGSTAAAM